MRALIERLRDHRSSAYMCQDCYDAVMDEGADAIEDLLAALEALVGAFRNPGDGGEFEDGEVPALDAARAAIAKAEGRS
jgi:hypothetical protein